MIPPAWTDVWITPYANGHLQAVGTDDAGRRQYLYHPRLARTRATPRSSSGCCSSARRSPRPASWWSPTSAARDAAGAGLRGRRTPARPGVLPDRQRRVRRRERQLRADHARAAARRAGRTGWSSRSSASPAIEHQIEIDDPMVVEAVDTMRRRRGGDRLLSYKEGRSWRSLAAGARQRLRPRVDRARGHRQGLPHLARHGAGRRRAGRDARARRDQGVAQAGGLRGDEGGRVVPRQHPDAGPVRLRRPARDRRPTRRAGPSSGHDAAAATTAPTSGRRRSSGPVAAAAASEDCRA